MTLFRFGAIVFGALAAVLIGIIVVGILLPSEWVVERTATVAAPAPEVFRHLDGARRWEAWTPSPETGFTYFGPDRGEGSGRRWDDPGYGEGEFVIVAAEPPSRLSYRVEVEGGAIRIHGELLLSPVPDGGTRVVWREEGDFGWNPLLGFLAGRMEELQGAQLDASLASLRRLVEETVSGSPD